MVATVFDWVPRRETAISAEICFDLRDVALESGLLILAMCFNARGMSTLSPMATYAPCKGVLPLASAVVADDVTPSQMVLVR